MSQNFLAGPIKVLIVLSLPGTTYFKISAMRRTAEWSFLKAFSKLNHYLMMQFSQ